MVRVEVHENDALVVANLANLLVVWSRVEERRVDPLGEGPLGPSGVWESTCDPAQLRCAVGPRRRNRPESDRQHHIPRPRHRDTHRLEARYLALSERVPRTVAGHSHRVRCVRSATRSFVAKARPRHGAAFAQRAIQGKHSITPDLYGLVDTRGVDLRREGTYRPLLGGVGAPHHQHVGARLEGNKVNRRIKALCGIVVPVIVFLVDGVGIFHHLGLEGSQLECQLANDREADNAFARPPRKEAYPDRAPCNNIHHEGLRALRPCHEHGQITALRDCGHRKANQIPAFSAARAAASLTAHRTRHEGSTSRCCRCSRGARSRCCVARG